MNKNVIALRKGFVVVPKGAGQPQPRVAQLVASVQAELMNLGYMLSEEAYTALSKATQNFIITFHDEVIDYLTDMLGNKHAYRAFYINFPKQVMEMSDVELFLNAVCHYWSGGVWEPAQEALPRGIKFERTKFTTLKLANERTFMKIFTNLVSINQALTPDDREIVAWFTTNCRDSLELPAQIPFKETLCLLASKGIDVPVSTPTDVLRIAVGLGGGDISLPNVPKASKVKVASGWGSWRNNAILAANTAARESFKFGKFKRAQRRFIMNFFEKSNLDLGEMQQRLGRFLRLGERLHVGEFSKTHPKTYAAFKHLREQEELGKIRTFEARVEMAFAKGGLSDGMKVLAERPGMFARRLDWMLRTYGAGTTKILNQFTRVASGVSLKVLFELYKHFEGRDTSAPRTIMLKAKSKMQTLPDLPALPAAIIKDVQATILHVISNGFKKQTPLGKVWIDPQLKSVPVPFAMRSLNSSVKTYIRGTRIPFNTDANVIRAFVHWFDEDGSQDLDLSAGFYSENMTFITQISWTALREFGATHSGDIRHRVGACAEYIDVSIDKMTEKGVRYVAVQVYNYNGRPMHEAKDCVFGIMGREHPESNKMFVPKTIEGCMKMANESTAVTICLLDLEERCFIWADLENDGSYIIQQNGKGTYDMLKALTHKPLLSVYDLLKLHADARGELVKTKTNADTKFEWEDMVTDYTKVASYMS